VLLTKFAFTAAMEAAEQLELKEFLMDKPVDGHARVASAPPRLAPVLDRVLGVNPRPAMQAFPYEADDGRRFVAFDVDEAMDLSRAIEDLRSVARAAELARDNGQEDLHHAALDEVFVMTADIADSTAPLLKFCWGVATGRLIARVGQRVRLKPRASAPTDRPPPAPPNDAVKPFTTPDGICENTPSGGSDD
jgi:hypothetical protein